MSVVVGDTRPVPAKRCQCGREGEWPGTPCPDCRLAAAPDVEGGGIRSSSPNPVAGQVVDVPGVRLTELARIANEEHRRTLAKGRELLECAIRCGAALLEAREKLPRGLWLDWVEENVEIHVTTAHRYMRLAEYAELVRKSDAESIEGAMKALADLPRRGQGPRGYSEADKAEWIKLVDQVGVKRAAKALGVSVSTIWKWASPNSNYRGRAPKLGQPIPFSEETVDRLAGWLVEYFGGSILDGGAGEYPLRVTPQVRADARRALHKVFDELQPVPSGA